MDKVLHKRIASLVEEKGKQSAVEFIKNTLRLDWKSANNMVENLSENRRREKRQKKSLLAAGVIVVLILLAMALCGFFS